MSAMSIRTRKRIDTTTVESPDSGIMDASSSSSSFGFSPAFSKPARNLSFEVESRSGDSSYASTRRLFDSSSQASASLSVANAVPYVVMVVVLASAAFTVITLTSVLNRDGGVWSQDSTKGLNGKYASMQFAHKARAKRLAEEGRLLPEDATVDEDGVQLGGKRAAMQYAHRLREAASAANAGAGEVDEEDIKKIYDSLVAGRLVDVGDDDDDEEEAREKKKVLLRIRDFAHLTTNRLSPVPLEDIETPEPAEEGGDGDAAKAEEEAEEEEKSGGGGDEVAEKEKVRPPAVAKRSPRIGRGRQTQRGNPFRKSVRASSRDGEAAAAADGEDDPFRFA